MPLNAEQEWTLVSCGLLALADRVLTGGEAARLLSLVEAYLDPEEQDLWMDLVCDKGALEAHFDHMRPPPQEAGLRLLENVWNTALADGDASLSEIRVFERIGERLSIDKSQLTVHRKTWTYAAMERAEVIAGFVANLLHRGARPTDEDRAAYQSLVGRLPLSKTRRERMLKSIDAPPTVETIVEFLRRFDRQHQMETLRAIAQELIRTDRRAAAREQMTEVLAAASLPQSILGDLPGFAKSGDAAP